MKYDAMHPEALELRSLFRARFGCSDAEEAMARELIALNLRIIELEKQLERINHSAFYRKKGRNYE
jgi:hypothetical protein